MFGTILKAGIAFMAAAAVSATAMALSSKAKSETVKKKTKPTVSPHWKLIKKLGKYFTYKYGNSIECQGAHQVLKRWFWPGFSFERLKESKALNPNDPRPQQRTESLENAQKRGQRVDDELDHWTRYGELPEKPHRCSVQLVKYFSKMGWNRYRTQPIVGIPQARVATKIDLVLQDQKKELILVEVKTRSNNKTFEKDIGEKMAEPLQTIPSTLANHAVIQAMLGKVCWEMENKERPPIKEVHVVVSNLTTDEIDDFTAGKDESMIETAIIEKIQKSVNKKRKMTYAAKKK